MKFLIFLAVIVALVAAQEENPPAPTDINPDTNKSTDAKSTDPASVTEEKTSGAAETSTVQSTAGENTTQAKAETDKTDAPAKTPDKGPAAQGSTKGGASSLVLLSPVLFIAVCLQSVV